MGTSKEEERAFLLGHRCHDVREVGERWKAIAARAGLTMTEVAEDAGLSIYGLTGGGDDAGIGEQKALYLSAGIHGDEPAAVEGLTRWAEGNIDLLSRLRVMIFPCLNPWGLVNNARVDSRGRDLNRLFDRERARPIREWRRFLGGRRFSVALTLHEDYDANGCYVYELGRRRMSYGDGLLRRTDAVLPREPGSRVEGRTAVRGVVRRTSGIERIASEIDGMPEAIYLYLHHARVSMTFETPSEYSLYERVRAQERAVAEAAEMSLDADGDAARLPGA